MASPVLARFFTARDAAPPQRDIRFGVLVVVGFCVFYGSLLGIKARAAELQSLEAVARGVATALVIFLPPYLVTLAVARHSFTRPALRVAALFAAVVGGLLAGCLVVDAVPPLAHVRRAPEMRHMASLLPLLAMGITGLAILLVLERCDAALRSLHEEATRRTVLAREAAQAHLLVLQAQVEPHFLFNSLAHVRRLYREDARAGQAMLRNLVRYLSAIGPVTGKHAIPLCAEVDLAIAYLEVQKVRMGERLAYSIDIDERASRTPVPPMLVTTLVENAIKHGLSALPEGGAIRIEASAGDGSTSIAVHDTGRGFQSTIGSGVGLSNARARLHALYGDGARLELARNGPRGVIARILVPCT
jgi:hypothetical protein